MKKSVILQIHGACLIFLKEGYGFLIGLMIKEEENYVDDWRIMALEMKLPGQMMQKTNSCWGHVWLDFLGEKTPSTQRIEDQNSMIWYIPNEARERIPMHLIKRKSRPLFESQEEIRYIYIYIFFFVTMNELKALSLSQLSL